MNCEKENSDVYYLLSELSKQIYQKQCLSLQHPYLQNKSDINKIKKLRSKAFEILLNKNVKTRYTQEKKIKETKDPIIEIYKYAFVLKLHMRHVSRGISLENLVDEFSANDLQAGSMVYVVLQLLTELKNLHDDEESDLNIFYYSNTNPALFECLPTLENVTQFQTYPIETFILSNKLDAILDIQKCYIVQQTATNSISRLYFYNQDILESSNKVEPTRCKIGIDWLCRPKSITDFCSRDTISYFLPQTTKDMDYNIEYDNESKEKIEIKWDVSWPDMKLVNEYAESRSNVWRSSKRRQYKDVNAGGIYDDIWEIIDITDTLIFNYNTWETLGEIESTKQPSFLTDTPNAILRLIKMKQICTLLLIPKKIVNGIDFPKEIEIQEFLKNIKLLLLGIETKSFHYNNKIGFCMHQNMVVRGLSNESLVDICQRFIYWGNCFKYLTELITPDSQSGKLSQEGLIFKAMCISIKEILLYYRATLLRIFKHINEYTGLLNMLNKVQPVALLLEEVAKLCQYNGENGRMGENCNIFTIINKKITKITLPHIALVFYTIFKSCCIVYFRFLQKWLFEGVCHDIYGEFMIKEHPQFLREKGPKFWTRSFTIHHESVPSFLNGVTDSILQCGKAVRLLKICDPKNPVCSVFTSSKPELKVCLSVAMLREQFKKCQEYKQRGEEALGRPVSLSVAIQDQKNAEREKADIVIRAQRDTLLRIKREQEEFLKTSIQNKKEFLKALKEQAMEATLCKAKEKQIELLTDKLLMEENSQREKELHDRKCSDRADIINYYADLDATIQKRQIHTEWRNKRMKYFDERVNSLFKIEEILWKSTQVSDSQVLQDVKNNTTEQPEETEEVTISEENVSNLQHVLNNAEPNSLCNSATLEDENSNFNKVEVMEIPHEIIHSDNINVTIQSDNRQNALQNISDNKNTKKQLPDISNTHNASMLETPANMNYVYKRNNETSNLQEFLRSEAIKELQSAVITNPFKVQPVINDNATKTLIYPMQTHTIPIDNKQVVNRPKVLKIERLDNMTETQRKKIGMLKNESDITPNNNQSNLFFVQKENNQNDFVIGTNLSEENNEHYLANCITNNVVNDQTKCINSTETITADCKKLDKISIENFEMNSANETTPMSCITDIFSLSIGSTIPYLQTYEDGSPLDINGLSPNIKLNSIISSGFSERMSAITTPSTSNTNCNTPDSTTSLTIADVELIDNTSLQVYLEKSIIIPLQIQSRIVNDALIKYLLNEHNMLTHLQSLRSYFFLLNGEFAKCLTNSLYARLYEISVPVELFNSATLTNLLERALISSFSSNYMNSELLSLSAIDTPMQLHISDPHALDCLCLSYKISWPLNIILDDTVMLQYSKVFKFLLMIGRVLWVLQEDFRMMKAEYKAAISEQYHKLQLYRHSMTQFICALHNYITCSVLHTSWIEFEKDLCNSLTIDQIRFSHVNYIKRILSRCMLNSRGEKVRTCLGNIFKVILKFHNRLRSQNWISISEGYIHPNFRKLEQMYEAFCELRTYLSRIALKLTTSGYQPHLIHFLNTLNINHIYDLTEKSS
ncbi:hypothetical protein KPH14_003303 [Odynerus spinipes]|uniref:Gamma-tubulin complex component 6 n=1 Tax=Odynerus spinipes TaxID=1348599 RepID=A0AAD9VJQ9_9HYME|nr:hypothetical protein KPH14_003303 [Odynerus spinipes]